MDSTRLGEFISNHPYLVMALLAITALLIGGEFRRRLSGVNEVTAGAAVQLINHENAVMVDMRSDKDYREGHIVSAIHTPDQDNSVPEKLEKYRDQPLIVYCRSGQQSLPFCKRLRNQGFASVYNLKGGILAWQQADLPVSKV
ncbi:MAG: rhodanese-like domain-containing protein [Gammaproteobacteria bacterium]